MEKGLDYDRESGRVKVSVKEVIPDFVPPPLKTAIEVKLVKEGTTVGRIVDEINADIRAYQKATTPSCSWSTTLPTHCETRPSSVET